LPPSFPCKIHDAPVISTVLYPVSNSGLSETCIVHISKSILHFRFSWFHFPEASAFTSAIFTWLHRFLSRQSLERLPFDVHCSGSCWYATGALLAVLFEACKYLGYIRLMRAFLPSCPVSVICHACLSFSCTISRIIHLMILTSYDPDPFYAPLIISVHTVYSSPTERICIPTL
jgi:hypothetical protein